MRKAIAASQFGTFFILGIWAISASAAISPRIAVETSPLALSAEYYVEHRQFERALDLYRALLKQEANVPRYWERAATLALYLDGRNSAQELVQKYLAMASDSTRRNWDALEPFLDKLHNAFLTDRAQALYLQGMVRFERSDCKGALPFFRESLDQEKNQLAVLRKQTECEFQLGNPAQAYDSLKASYTLNPASRPLAESLAEMHLYYGAVGSTLDLVKAYGKLRSASHRLLIAEAVALARKTEREGAWQAFRRLDIAIPKHHLPAIVLWEKAKLLETDPKRKSALAKSQLTSWLKQFVVSIDKGTDKRALDKAFGFDPYRTSSFKDEAIKWLASLNPK